jgi:hypothetical protein
MSPTLQGRALKISLGIHAPQHSLVRILSRYQAYHPASNALTGSLLEALQRGEARECENASQACVRSTSLACLKFSFSTRMTGIPCVMSLEETGEVLWLPVPSTRIGCRKESLICAGMSIGTKIFSAYFVFPSFATEDTVMSMGRKNPKDPAPAVGIQSRNPERIEMIIPGSSNKCAGTSPATQYEKRQINSHICDELPIQSSKRASYQSHGSGRRILHHSQE